MNFLSSLAMIHKPIAQRDYTRLQDLKRLHTKQADAILEPWDKLFYSQFVSPRDAVEVTGDPFHASPHHDVNEQISQYFSVGRTFEGISRLFTALYGISLVPAKIKSGEVWHEDVRKLDVIDQSIGKKIGTVYCDLFIRDEADARKYDNAVHSIM
jgi:intermediate peptidase